MCINKGEWEVRPGSLQKVHLVPDKEIFARRFLKSLDLLKPLKMPGDSASRSRISVPLRAQQESNVCLNRAW